MSTNSHVYVIVSSSSGDWVKGYLDGEYIGEGHNEGYFSDELHRRLGVIAERTIEIPDDEYEEHLWDDDYYANLAQGAYNDAIQKIAEREKSE